MQKKKSLAPRDLLNEARRFVSNGDLLEGRQALLRLVEDYPEDEEARFFLASAFFRSKLYADAISHFERVLKLNPVHEWASIGLFHALWQVDRGHDALEEIRRFRSAGGDSMEYRRLLKDISGF